MNGTAYRLTPFDPAVDLNGFDCGEPSYNQWLTSAAARAHESGSAHVTLLIEISERATERVVGYFAICPTLVVRDQMPHPMQRRMLRSTPGWLIAKLALAMPLRATPQQWGRQLLREALVQVIAAADRGGGAIVVVDADNDGLVPFYERNGFVATGGDDLRLFMKIATARAYLTEPG
ncbi:N-acetyltransferase [uncultured Jatrophihabitans sp.]|uniref:N-acetyltransferase n=1 Tax=uncultured Jatrophihabitans sp. TaxID=1610747 RepID=UPI0035CBC1C9